MYVIAWCRSALIIVLRDLCDTQAAPPSTLAFENKSVVSEQSVTVESLVQLKAYAVVQSLDTKRHRLAGRLRDEPIRRAEGSLGKASM